MDLVIDKLLLVETQGYIHYSKGALVFYALADAIGEDTLNAAIAAHLKKVAFSGPPYPVSTEFLADIEKVVPPEHAYLIEDLFKSITLYENRASKATASVRPDGKYDVVLTVTAKKMRADGLGAEEEVPMNDFVDVGWEDAKGAIHVEKQKVAAGERTLTFVAADKPVKAGIDPLNKLIDRKADDNSVAISD